MIVLMKRDLGRQGQTTKCIGNVKHFLLSVCSKGQTGNAQSRNFGGTICDRQLTPVFTYAKSKVKFTFSKMIHSHDTIVVLFVPQFGTLTTCSFFQFIRGTVAKK